MNRIVALAALSIFCALSSEAVAQQTFRLFSPSTGKCMSLAAADQANGGGLVLRSCQNFPDFLVSGLPSLTQITFELNSHRFVCVAATETPQVTPSGTVMPVESRTCGGVGSMWNVRGEDGDGLRQIEKAVGLDPTNFCMQADAATGTIRLEVCQGLPEQQWRFDRVSFPPLP